MGQCSFIFKIDFYLSLFKSATKLYGHGRQNLVVRGTDYQIQKRKRRDGAYFWNYKQLKMPKNAYFQERSILIARYPKIIETYVNAFY